MAWTTTRAGSAHFKEGMVRSDSCDVQIARIFVAGVNVRCRRPLMAMGEGQSK
jgi:hypothetical protein